MCRWIAYAGPPLRVSTLLFQPENSLIRQSLHATRGVATNGDGFGLGWYGERPFPGLYRDILPAWNDANLHSLADQVRARLFFAHVRASTGTATSRENCHPFAYEHLLFMHNGRIGGYDRIRRRLEGMVADEFYARRHGSTDSELFFLLALSNGLMEEPIPAIARTVRQVRREMALQNVEEPFRMTAALSDGERIIAVRTSSDGASPSLFHTAGGEILADGPQLRFTPGRGTVMVLSEPLDAEGHWQEVPEDHVLETRQGEARVRPIPLDLVGAA